MKSLETKQLPGVQAGPIKSASADDPENAFLSLRRALEIYQKNKAAADVTNKSTGEAGHEGSSSAHSLEHVPSVCRAEALSMRRVRAFCSGLPQLLSGGSLALFEVVVFFNARYVEATSRCVLRFAKNLPIIVNRVVKSRKKHVRLAQNKENAGFGVGSVTPQQRMEDIPMKPVVLVGAPIFAQQPLSKETSSKLECSTEEEEAAPSHTEGCSTCGVMSVEEINVCDELKSVIYPSDSIEDVTDKIGRWEGASYRRLSLELAMVDVASHMSDILWLNDHPFAIMSHLHLPTLTTERVSLTIQKLACGLCFHCDEQAGVHSCWSLNDIDDELTTSGLSACDKIKMCRRLARVTTSFVEGNISLMWEDLTPLVQTASEVSVGDEEEMEKILQVAAATARGTGVEKYYRVMRHTTCCDAEMLKFSVYVTLSKDINEFLDRLAAALHRVACKAKACRHLLPELLALRSDVVCEEFIPLTKCETKSPTVSDNVDLLKSTSALDPTPSFSSGAVWHLHVGDVQCCAASALCYEELARQHRYRGPIRCFPRVFAMETEQELIFWRNVHDYREFVAAHAPAMNPINVFYECTPYSPHTRAIREPLVKEPEEMFAGWLGEAEEGVGNAVITHRELQCSASFRAWLEEVVEQSVLDRECRRLLTESGIGYIVRDPSLPLAQFLSFLKVFVGATAVRAVLEGSSRTTRTITSEDVGFVLVVGATCDVRDGGQFVVPWWADPSLLVPLLEDGAAGCGTLIEMGG
ncbi:hypothetical protein ERJ75_000293200 [Trypanosoma vivax]|nr:hypothetical protein ERJ75_000293200 [Trypanosoma vivax]